MRKIGQYIELGDDVFSINREHNAGRDAAKRPKILKLSAGQRKTDSDIEKVKETAKDMSHKCVRENRGQ